jgi:hypothetical protein
MLFTIDEYRRAVIDPQEVDRRGDDGDIAILYCALKAAGNRRSGELRLGVVTSQGRGSR